MKHNLKLFGLILFIIILGCSRAPDLQTPAKIGEKNRSKIITGKLAAQVVNKLHRSAVAGDANVIAEYGGDKKDLLYITYYSDQKEAKKAFSLMIEKMSAAKNSPFFQLMPLAAHKNQVYFTLGMGAAHYIYLSGNYLLWFQTHQSFGNTLPPHLLEFYPI